MKVGGKLKETILYISKSEQDIQSFLKYLQSKLKAEQKGCTLDEKYDILKVPKYYDIVGKSVHGTMLGAGYGYCKDCGNCKYHQYEDISQGWVCCNQDSEYVADWTDYTDCCEEWESRDEM